MTKRIHILVEGQTEETFVKEMLAPHLLQFDIFPHVTMVCTKAVRGVRKYRGGINNYSQIKRDVERLCKDSAVVAITTLFDFYAFPTSTPGMDSLPVSDCYKQVAHIESHIKSDISDKRYIPFVMLHEFETIIFCDPQKLQYSLPSKEKEIQKLIEISKQFESPELINNSPATAPSKRILSVLPEYDKILHGSITALEVGMDQIRSKCSHFDAWLTQLESL